MASITDLLLSVGKRGTLTTLKPPGKPVGAESLKIEQSLNWPTDSKVAFSIRQVNVGGENDGREIEGTYTEWTGILNTEDGSIDNLHLEQGDDQDYPPGDGTEVFIHVSVTIWEHLMQALRNVITMDGKLKKSAVDTALGTSVDQRWKETFTDYIVAGTGVVTIVSGTTIATANITYYIDGVRYIKTEIANKVLTPTKDVYRFINKLGVITEIEKTIGDSAPSTPIDSILMDMTTTGATTVASVSLRSRGAIKQNNIDMSTFSPLVAAAGGNTSGGNRTLVTIPNYKFMANIPYLVLGSIQGDTVNGGSSVWEHRLTVNGTYIATSRAAAPSGAASVQRGASMQGIIRFPTNTTADITLTTTLLAGTNTISTEIPRVSVVPLIAA